MLHASSPANAACPPSEGSKGRTGHLSVPYLLDCVNTGSPKRAPDFPATRMATEPS